MAPPAPPRSAAVAATAPITAPAPSPRGMRREEVESIAAGVGLELVETRPQQLGLDVSASVPAPRPTRQRRPRVTPPSEPLQQVETQPGGEPL